jgi:hypothetical protein
MDVTRSSKLVGLIRSIVAELFPGLDYLGQIECEITSQSGAFVSVRPTSPKDNQKLPDLSRIPFRGAAGIAGQHVVGTRVAVAFVYTDPDLPPLPYIAAVAGADDSGFLPTVLRIDASNHVDVGASALAVNLAEADAFVLRDGDTIQLDAMGGIVAGGSGTLTSVIGTIKLGPSVVAPGAPPAGRSKVKA